MTEPDTHAPPAACEHCSTVLIGGYCHLCGQRGHNPLHSFAHALEDVFESFWHLDGRIFRTVRDLFVPGRVAANYLAGHRVRYIPPLRLFVILSLLTFFVGKLTLHLDADTKRNINSPPSAEAVQIAFGEYATADTIAEVVAIREQLLGELDTSRGNTFGVTAMSLFGPMAERTIREGALKRMQSLGATPEQLLAASPPPSTKPANSTRDATSATPPAGLIERWARKKTQRIEENVAAIQKDPDTFVKLVLGAVPGALFILMPLFALCLKLLYVRSGRGYLEHLVVALYSNAFMLAALLLTFVMIGLQSIPGLPPVWVGMSGLVASLTLSLIVPMYLLWMQKRVYGQSWGNTLVKYAILGGIYSVLLGLAIVYAVLAGLSS